jgi:hypothetical protein
MKIMKKTVPQIQLLLSLFALSLIPSVSLAADDIIIGPANGESSVSNPDGTWINMWGPAFMSTTFDPTTPPPSGNTTGSVYNHGDWTGDTGGMDNYNMISPGTSWNSVSFDGSQYSSIEMDIKYDTTSTMTPNSAAHLGIGFDKGYSFVDLTDLSFSATSPYADGHWHHLSIFINPATPGISSVGGVSYYQWNPGGTSGTMNFWMANVKVIANIVSVLPPTLSITKPSPGLHFVQGSISGQFDRQNIITAGGANSTANYSWAGKATPGNPVTYSVNISQFTAPDINYHIYLYQTAGAGGASAPDYNQANVVIFQISPTANNTQAIGTIFWKTNEPSASATNVATVFTNSTLTGTWSLKFTSDTSGQVIAPGGNTYPFTLDPSIPANLANPITVNFGINPSINSGSIIGEEVLVSQASITGVDPLSVNYPTTDNFLQDSVLDTNTWTVNALYPASIWFVPASDVFSVNWTLPDSGFTLLVSTNLSNLSTAPNPSLPPVLLTPGVRTLIPKSSLPAGNIGFFALVQRLPYQLQVLLPGETNAPNTVSGKVGTPIAQSDSTPTTVTINMCDANWNIVNSADTIHLTSTDGAADLPNDAALANGTLQEQLIFGSQSPPTYTVTASDDSHPTILSNTSSAVTVGP